MIRAFLVDSHKYFDLLILKSISAPLCPTPPEKTFEGKLSHIPKVIDVGPEEECSVDGDPIHIKCHSFLSIHIVSTTYGREKADKKLLCNGEEDTVELQSQHCLETDAKLRSLHANCRGKSQCKSYWTKPVGIEWKGECNETLTRKNELTVQYRCGN